MNKITRLECEEIIDKLADKTLSFGCLIKSKNGAIDKYIGYVGTYQRELQTKQTQISNLHQTNNNYIDDSDEEGFQILGHPIMLGDILKRFIDKQPMIGVLDRWVQVAPLNWSLQQILEEAEEADGFITSPASDLFLFLKKLV